MTTSNLKHSTNVEYPTAVSRSEWLAARKQFLIDEKEFTRLRDQLNAQRRRLPMVKIDKEHIFDDPDGKVRLLDLFEGRRKGETYFTQGELHGLTVFLRDGESIFRTYSTYARGTDLLAGTYVYLDLTPFGRQEDWEQPPGRSDGPFMHWVRHHDRYEDGPKASASCCGSAKDHS
jgi:predicted dithiol-disulfide oxidoreductase (DUF899 family)